MNKDQFVHCMRPTEETLALRIYQLLLECDGAVQSMTSATYSVFVPEVTFAALPVLYRKAIQPLIISKICISGLPHHVVQVTLNAPFSRCDDLGPLLNRLEEQL